MMDSDSDYNIFLTSAAVAIGCVCATYYFTTRRNRLRDAIEAFHYLNINVVTTEEACDEVVRELWRYLHKLMHNSFKQM